MELFPFPNRDMNPLYKDNPKYHRKWSEAIYSIYISGRSAWGVGDLDTMTINRSYSRGRQGTDKYKKFLLEEEQSDGTTITSVDDMPISRVARREGWLNVLWENLSIGPKLMNSMHGMFDSVDFDLYVDAVDPDSMSMQENAKYLALVKGQNEQWQNEYRKRAGIPIDENTLNPKTRQELEAIDQQGGFKLGIAKAMEKLAKHSFNVSQWDGVIKKKITDDLVTIRRCATHDRYDSEDGMFKTEYIDPSRLVIQYSDDGNYAKSEYGGYFRLISVSDLKKRMPELGDDELRKVARSNQGLFGNPHIQNDGQWQNMYDLYDEVTQTWGWYDFKLCVFETAWMDWDVSYATEYTTNSGKTRYKQVAYDAKLSARDENRKTVTVIRKPRQCTWVVGTKHVFDYGLVHMAPRPQPSKPRLPFHVEELHGPSLIEQAIPIMDQIQLLWLRYQNSVAKMIESGFAVDFGMILNISDGKDKKYPVDQILKMWKQTGILPFMPSRYGNYQGGAVTPVHPLPSDFRDKLEATIMGLDFQFRMFEQVTGINPITLGQTPSPDAPVGTTEAALQATNNLIKPIAASIFELKRGIGECLVSRIQTGIRVSDRCRKAYAGVIGTNDIDLLRKAEESSVRYGLSMKAKPDQLYRQKLTGYIEIALASGRDGKEGINIGEAMLLEEKLWRGADIADIRNELTYLIEKSKQQISAEKKALIDQTTEGNLQLEDKKNQTALAQHKMNLQTAVVTETEKRKTARLNANNQFLQLLVEQSNKEKEAGGITDDTFNRLRLALNIAGRVGDLSLVDLPAMVGRYEGVTRAPQLNQQSA